jgi:hypothetical protein
MASLPVIRQQIGNADVNSTNLVKWVGVNGLENITSEIVDVIRDRGFMVVDDLTQLSLLGYNDTALVVVDGYGFYVFNPNVPTPVPPTSILANGGGVWDLLSRSVPEAFVAVIGDNVSTSFTLTHNLNTLYPTVSIWNTAGGTPYTLSTALFTITADSANAITVSRSPAIGNNSFTVVVKK